jgi:hypothetical protein
MHLQLPPVRGNELSEGLPVPAWAASIGSAVIAASSPTPRRASRERHANSTALWTPGRHCLCHGGGECAWLARCPRGCGPARVRLRWVQSGSARGSPKIGSALLSGNPVIALIWLPARVSTRIPLAWATGACGSRM